MPNLHVPDMIKTSSSASSFRPEDSLTLIQRRRTSSSASPATSVRFGGTYYVRPTHAPIDQWLQEVSPALLRIGPILAEEGYESADLLEGLEESEIHRLDMLLQQDGVSNPVRAKFVRVLRQLAKEETMYQSGRPTMESEPTLKWKLGKQYAAFLSHYKAESAMEARHLKDLLERELGAPIFLDSDDLSDLRLLLCHVANSDVLLVFETKGLLTRPYCLLEILKAIEEDVPIVAVNVRGAAPFSFSEAANTLRELDTRLEEEQPGALSVLKENGVDVLDAAYKLSNVLPNIISIDFNPSGSRNCIDACVLDIVGAMRVQSPVPITQSLSEWLAQRDAVRHHRSCYSWKVDVFCRFNLFNIEDIDAINETLSARFYFEAAWSMPSAANETGGLKPASLIDWDSVWKPRINFVSAVGLPEISSWNAVDPQYAEKFGQPMASWRAKISGRFRIPGLGMKQFPFDVHDLPVIVSSDNDCSLCSLHANNLVPSLVQTHQFALHEWSMSCSDSPVRILEDRAGAMGHAYPQLSIINVKVSRQPGFWVRRISIAIFVAAIPGLLAFTTPLHDHVERLKLTAISMIAIIAIKEMIIRDVPQLPYPTYLDWYFTGALALISCCCLQSVVLASFSTKTANGGGTSAERLVDMILGTTFATFWLVGHALLAFSRIRAKHGKRTKADRQNSDNTTAAFQRKTTKSTSTSGPQRQFSTPSVAGLTTKVSTPSIAGSHQFSTASVSQQDQSLQKSCVAREPTTSIRFRVSL